MKAVGDTVMTIGEKNAIEPLINLLRDTSNEFVQIQTVWALSILLELGNFIYNHHTESSHKISENFQVEFLELGVSLSPNETSIIFQSRTANSSSHCSWISSYKWFV